MWILQRVEVSYFAHFFFWASSCDRDPQIQPQRDGGDFASALYNGNSFLDSLYNGLSADGIMMAQVGQAPRSSEPAENNSWMENRLKFVERLTSLGFQSIQDYDEVRKVAKVAISSLVWSQLVYSYPFLP